MIFTTNKEGKVWYSDSLEGHNLNTQFGQNIYQGSQESIMINLINSLI